jgi:predicted transcriptional regulator
MKVRDLVEKLNLTVFSGHNGLDAEVRGGYTSDLLSDVMGNAQDGMVWVTLQTHKNIMAIASLKELVAVVIVKGYVPDEATLAQSNEEEIPLLGTSMQAFETSGMLYGLLNNTVG